MSSVTPRLGLPLLTPSQARKDVTLNESASRLDLLVQLSVESRTQPTQPATAPSPSVWILPPGATGAIWSAHPAHSLMLFEDGEWVRLEARRGFVAHCADTGRLAVHDGTGWSDMLSDTLGLGGGSLTGPLALPLNGLRVGAGQLAVKDGCVSMGSDTVSGLTQVQIVRDRPDTLRVGAPYNGGVAARTGDVSATIEAWDGRPQLLLLRHHVNQAWLGVSGGGDLELGILTEPRVVLSWQGHLRPALHAAGSLGSPVISWSDVYTQNPVTVTSDVRGKTDVRACPLGLDFVRALRPVAFRLRCGGIDAGRAADCPADAAPGGTPAQLPHEGVRFHTGFIAQEVREAVPEGLDWAGWCLADKADPDSPQALRYEALIAPLVAAVQELSARLLRLEQPLARSAAE